MNRIETLMGSLACGGLVYLFTWIAHDTVAGSYALWQDILIVWLCGIMVFITAPTAIFGLLVASGLLRMTKDKP